MTTQIYYFTGTGNSLKVAKDIAREIGDCTLTRITSEVSAGELQCQSVRIGIIFPVYYYGLPIMVKKFIENFNTNPKNYIFAIATCGGSVGASMNQIEMLLSLKGLSLSAGFRIVMPDNFQLMYGPASETKQQKLFKQQESFTKDMVEIVRDNRLIPFREQGKYFTKVLGGIFSKTFNPKGKDQNFWTQQSCNGCGICGKVCPADNIEIIQGKPVWRNNCELCLGCMQWCPQKALQYKQGTVKRARYQHPEIKVKELY
ncbi:4Fe-4S ferredoxin [Alkalicella caledoniensis]|uniref:4Fe-4S ferredoxin n=1 Tax=Alkalicella caledoniensis TaxID=2731377 RepID=A0A7G9W9S2_ALKCA|nr:EFR1 family ferrodoxin [Alkalicella caledoniensis]QNO15434.1 4Fe-4S ferredoxin [Alkalicella caledoniensis]